jgi:hypothetical protein
VSRSVSPFFTELDPALRLIVSADKRFPATSKLASVLVLGSKNTFTIVLPRRVGTFLIARSETSTKEWAVSR